VLITTTQYDIFNLANELQIIKGKGGLPVIKVNNEYATALISIYGAQVLSFKKKSDSNLSHDSKSNSQNREDKELLFLSDKAHYETGKAIKGGIPICWPWFGQDPEKRGRQAHGFARNVMWKMVSTSSNALSNKGAGTQIVLALNESEETKKLWPYTFELSLTIDIGKTLKLSLKTSNNDTQAFTITQALHTYFAVSNIEKIRIAGLNKSNYIDTTLKGMPVLEQVEDIDFHQEVDRIYIQGPVLTLFDDGNIHDHKNGHKSRQINIQSKGSKTTVIWNPWVEISTKSVDLSNDAYKHFVCIETANAAEDVIEVLPNESFTLKAEYSY